MYALRRPLPRFLLGILFLPLGPRRPNGPRRGYRNVTGRRPRAEACPRSTAAAARTLGSVLS